MKSLITINLSRMSARDGASGEWTPPTLSVGDHLTLAFRFERDIEGEGVPVSVDVQNLVASVGHVDARPERGRWRLLIGDGPMEERAATGWMEAGVGPQELARAINALGEVVAEHGTAEARLEAGSWVLVFAEAAAPVPLLVDGGELWPTSVGRVRSWQAGGRWQHEIRLTQTPVAFTDESERILPPPPSISQVRAGGSEGELIWSEVQALRVPPEFRGTYFLRWNYRRTALLSQQDGPEEIAAALAALGYNGFEVASPEDYVAHITFAEELSGVPQPLIEVVVMTHPEGDLTVRLDLDRAELFEALRGRTEATFPLEVRCLVVVDEVARPLVLLRVPLTISTGVYFEQLATVPQHDWLRPPSPKSYVPRDPSQVITGSQYHIVTLGDGEALEFAIAHHLGTSDLAGVWLRENVAGGRLLVLGVDFNLTVDSDDEVTVTFAEVPDEASVVAVLATAGPVSAFIENLLVTIPQVIGLELLLEGLGERLETLESILPTTGAGTTTTERSEPVWQIELPELDQVLFVEGTAEAEALERRRAPLMLPALHVDPDPIPAIPDPLPEPVAGALYQNATSAPVAVQVSGRLRREDGVRHVVPPSGYLASDGRTWFPAVRDGETYSYYPAAFERLLFWFPVSERVLRVGRVLDCQFGLGLRTVHATSAASWVLEIGLGSAPQDLEPDPTGLNLQNIVWDAEPVLRTRIVLADLLTRHTFGLRIKRSAGGLSMDLAEYGVWEGRDGLAPSSANFAVRARLIQFDTENSAPTARGFVQYQLLGAGDQPAQAFIS